MHGRRPALILLLLAFCIHVLGRAAALSGTGEFDSFLYSVAARQAWQPQASVDVLVSDKPAGQAVLTGWCYRLWPGRPSRLVLVPIESVFLLGGLAAVYLIGTRFSAATPAAAAAVVWALAVGRYTLDDGFNLNECYAAGAVLLAVAAHLSIRRAGLRGLARGAAFGLALTIKQSAAAAIAACVIDGLIRHARDRQGKQAAASIAGSIIGLALGAAPVALFLASRGWLGSHLHDLGRYSGLHAGRPFSLLPNLQTLAPLWIVGWWTAMALAVGRTAKAGGTSSTTTANPHRPGVAFLPIWFVLELGTATAMLQPRLHYFIMVAGPACLLGTVALSAWWRAVQGSSAKHRRTATVWMITGSALLVAWTLLPLASTLGARGELLHPRIEAQRFARWLEHWTATPPGPYFRGILDAS